MGSDIGGPVTRDKTAGRPPGRTDGGDATRAGRPAAERTQDGARGRTSGTASQHTGQHTGQQTGQQTGQHTGQHTGQQAGQPTGQRAGQRAGDPERAAPHARQTLPAIEAALHDDVDEEAPDGLFRRAGRVGWNVVVVLLPVFLLAGLAAGLGYVRLKHGPVSLKPLAGPIAQGLGAELPGFDVRIDDAVLRLATDGSFEFRLKDVRIHEKDGDLVASAPEAAAHLSMDGLWSWRLVPSRVDLIAPRLNLLVDEAGNVALRFTETPRTDAAAAGAAAGAPPGGTGPGASGPGGAGPAEVSSAKGGQQPVGARDAGGADAPGLKRIDLARMLTEQSRRARRGLDATSYLREIGMRDATILVDNQGRKTQWRVPELSIDLEHKKRSSVIAGLVKVQSTQGPWSIGFRTEESDKTNSLVFKAAIRDFVPAAIEGGVPGLGPLEALGIPLASDVTIELTSDGEIRAATAAVEIGRGRIGGRVAGAPALAVEGGLLDIAYDAAARRFDLKPSQLRWGGGRMTLTGAVRGGVTTDGRPGWAFEATATEGALTAADIGMAPLALDAFRLAGHWLPAEGRLQVTQGTVKAGGAEIVGEAEIDTLPAASGVRVSARSGAMALETLKAMWPQGVAPGARKWVTGHVSRAKVQAATFGYLSGTHLREQAPGAAAGADRLTLAIEAADAVLQPVAGMSPVEAPKALVNLENATLEVAIPEAAIAVGPGRRVPLKALRLLVADVVPKVPDGEVSFKVQGALPPVLAVLDQEPLGLLRKAGHSFDGLDGKVEAQIRLRMPLSEEIAVEDIRFDGRARVYEARGKQIVGGYDVQGATVTFDLAEASIDAKGEMLVGGVLAKIGWQHIIGADEDRQPPLRVTATLDNSDRNQLGLDIGHFVQGEVPVEVTVTRGARGGPQVRARADLTSAELMLDAVAWRKAPGRTAYLQFDIQKPRPGRTELVDVKLAGDDVAIEGTAALGPDNRLREFHFPEFTLNVVSRLDIQGRYSPAGVWDVKVRGRTFDGRDFFRSLFTVSAASDKGGKPQKARDGVDLDADVDTVLGFSDTSLKGLRIKASKRGDRLVSLEATGALDSGKPVSATIPNEPKETRRLLANTTDAGQAFKLVGFYPNVQGGRARLEVNLEGKGAAEKTGILWVEDFVVLGDPVVAEVVGSAGDDPIDRTGARTKQRMVRQAFNFDRMKAPFSVGHGQFVLDDSYVKGPILGANIRGKVDYRARTVNLGGTYVPLQGLNNVLGDIPLLGAILSGPRSEGIFGITYAIQGPMASPQVIVNPLSILTPGITRELTQMGPLDAAVQARDDKKPAGKPETRTRASSAPADTPRGPRREGAVPSGGGAAAPASPVDGWSSETKAAPVRK